MIIENIWIKGYRSIKDCSLRLSSFQMMLGKNNSGKSNVLRATKLFFENEDVSIEDFYQNAKGERAQEIRITVQFSELSDGEKREYSKYILQGGRLRVMKVARSDESPLSKPEYHGVRLIPVDPKLRPESYTGTPKENFEELEKVFGDISQHRPQGAKASQSSFAETLNNLVESRRNGLQFAEELEVNQFMGWKNVASGKIGTFLMIPAIPDPRNEAEIRKGSHLAELLSPILDSIVQTDPDYRKAVELLTAVTHKMTKRMPDGSPGTERPKDLTDLESEIERHLKDWQIRVMLQFSPLDMKSSILQTDMIVDDGHQSSVDFKGHGLQRAFIIAVLNVWKDRLLQSQHAEARAAAKLVVIAIEEPELYLHPQQQRSLFQTLKEISNVKGHQVLVSSHSPFFIDMDNPLSTFCVSRDAGGEGTKVVQLDKHPFEGEGNAERKHRFQATQWLDPSRGEMFFAERVALIEGPTEKAVIPYVASRIGMYRPSVTIVDCGGKGNISLFVRILNAFKIPYVVIYDEDPIGDCSPAEKNYEHKVRMFRCNEEIKNLTIGNGEYRMMSPNFDDVVGVPKSQIEIKGKPLAVIDYIEQNGVPERVEELVRWVYTKVD